MSRLYVAHCQNGCYQFDRRVWVDERLRDHPYAQCGIIYQSDGTQLFVSYETIVAELGGDGWLHLCGEYSTTTSKQISWWLRQWSSEQPYSSLYGYFGWSYRQIRDYYRRGLDVNLLTGKTRERVEGVQQTIGIRV